MQKTPTVFVLYKGDLLETTDDVPATELEAKASKLV